MSRKDAKAQRNAKGGLHYRVFLNHGDARTGRVTEKWIKPSVTRRVLPASVVQKAHFSFFIPFLRVPLRLRVFAAQPIDNKPLSPIVDSPNSPIHPTKVLKHRTNGNFFKILFCLSDWVQEGYGKYYFLIVNLRLHLQDLLSNLVSASSGNGSAKCEKARNPKKTLGYEKDLHPQQRKDSGIYPRYRYYGCHRRGIDPVLIRKRS